MTQIRLAWIQTFTDRHGKRRFYFRRPGFARVPLPGVPGSAAFMAAYQAALGAAPSLPVSRAAAGSLGALIEVYYHSAEWRALRASTQRGYRTTLERLREMASDLPVARLERGHVKRWLAALSPGVADKWRKRLRTLMGLAIELGWRQDDPTMHLKKPRQERRGHHSWDAAEIRQFEQHFPLGTRERLAFALLLYTGQRRSDVVRLGRQHLRGEKLVLRQLKTGQQVTLPVHARLAEALAAGPCGDLAFLVSPRGRPWTSDAFGMWFHRACKAVGLEDCAAHGLRKACGVRLAEAGASTKEIMAVLGHRSLAEAERYTRAAEEARLAASGMARLGGETGTASVKPSGSGLSNLGQALVKQG